MADFYVATTGSNSNAGTMGSPWLTLDYALSRPALAAGDTIHLAAGDYSDVASTYKSGASGNPITIVGAGVGSTFYHRKFTIQHAWYNVSGIKFDGYIASSNTFFKTAGIVCHGASATDIIVDGCAGTRCDGVVLCESDNAGFPPARVTVRNCDLSYGTGAGSVTISGTDHKVYGCSFHDSVNDAMRVFGDNPDIHNNTYTRIYAPKTTGITTTSSDSVTLGNGSHTWTVPAGLIITPGYQMCAYSQSAPTTQYMVGFVTAYSGTSLTLACYSTTGSGTYSDWGFETGTTNDNGQHADLIQTFITSTGTGTTNLKWHDNVVSDTTCQWGNLENDATNSLSHDFFLYNNTFLRSRIQLNNYIPNVSLYNNSIYDTAGFDTGFGCKSSSNKGTGSNAKVYNNIYLHVDGTLSGTGAYSGVVSLGGSADYNILTTQSDGAFTSLDAGAHSINGGVTPAQVYINAAAGDLTINYSSAAAGAATDLSAYFTTDINGATRTAPWSMGAYNPSGTPPATPTAPSGLTATQAGSSVINLAWTDNSSDEVGFKIDRSPTGSGSWVQIATVSSGVVSYSDEGGLTPATTYYYRVRAYNGAGDSANSNTANATTANLSGGTARNVVLLMAR